MNMQSSRGRGVRPVSDPDAFRANEAGDGVSGETLPDLPPGESPPPESGAQESGSLWSHAAYGLVPVAILAPFAIPGISRQALLFTYLALGSGVSIILMTWGVVRASREARRARRGRRSPHIPR